MGVFPTDEDGLVWFPCQDCKAAIYHWRGGGDEVCEKCGALHNAFGQRLRDDAPRF